MSFASSHKESLLNTLAMEPVHLCVDHVAAVRGVDVLHFTNINKHVLNDDTEQISCYFHSHSCHHSYNQHSSFRPRISGPLSLRRQFGVPTSTIKTREPSAATMSDPPSSSPANQIPSKPVLAREDAFHSFLPPVLSATHHHNDDYHQSLSSLRGTPLPLRYIDLTERQDSVQRAFDLLSDMDAEKDMIDLPKRKKAKEK